MENELEIFGNTELHDRALRELYKGDDIDDPRFRNQFSRYIFYDVLTPENEMVPTVLIVSSSGNSEDMLSLFSFDLLSVLLKQGEDTEIADFIEKEGSDEIIKELQERFGDEIKSKINERLGDTEKVLFIKNISTKEGYKDEENKVPRIVRSIMEESDVDTAIYLAETDKDATVFMEDDFEIDSIEGGWDINVWVLKD
jgi:hypothetical protein